MKKLFTKLMALVAVLVLSAGNLGAQTFTFDAAIYNSSVGYEQTGVGVYNKATTIGTTAISTTNANCNGVTNSVSTSSSKFYFKPDFAITSIEIRGKGTGNNRVFSSIKTSATLGGAYSSITPGTVTNNMASSANCGNITIPGINVAAGTYIEVTLSGNININSIVLTAAILPPSIKTFTVAGIVATINETNKTITAELPYGTNLTAITPVVTTGGGIATLSYLPTTAQDFTNSTATPITYSVTDGTTTTNYAVTLTASSVANSDATLSDLKVDNITVTGFSASTLTYDIALPYAYTGLPTISATANAVTSSKTFTQATAIPGTATVVVKAQDNSEKTYTINFTRTPASSSCDITSFTINNKIGVINGTNITVQLHLTTNVASLSPVVNVSQFATYTPSSPVNFSSPVEYIITAQDGTQKTYTVTVELIDMVYNGTYPYTTNFPSGFVMPNWMSSPNNGIIFTNPYSGSDKGLWYDDETEITAATSSVIRLNSATAMEFYVSKCQTVTVKLSATGSRTFNMYINGNSTPVATATVSSNTMATLTYSPNLNEPTLIKVDNPSTSGGATLGFFEVTASFGSGLLSNSSGSTLSFDGKTLHNPTSELVHVFDATGRLVVSSTKDVVLSSTAKGIYFVKSNSGNFKIALNK